jgi:hypothetical protein
MAWKGVSKVINGFQDLEYLHKIIIHARDIGKDEIQAQQSNGQESEDFCPN